MRRFGRHWLALACLAPASACFAISLGDVQVISALDEPLDARIAVALAHGESVRGNCFALAPAGPSSGDLSALGPATLTLRRSLHGTYLQLQTNDPVTQPALGFVIAVGCGPEPRTDRQFALLLDAPGFAPTPVASPARPPVAVLSARSGDTLESLARAVHPSNVAAREAYLAALRAANPALGSRAAGDPIAEATPVALPDLRIASRLSPAVGAQRAAAADSTTRAPTPPVVAVRTRPQPRIEVATPMRAPAVFADGGFHLKLSASLLDLRPSRGMTEAQRAKLRERLATLDADDQAAAMLSLRNTVRELEARIGELKMQLALADSRAAAAPPPVSAGSAPRPAASAASPPQAQVAASTVPVQTPPATAQVQAPAPQVQAPGPAPRAESAAATAVATSPPQSQRELPRPQVVPRPAPPAPWALPSIDESYALAALGLLLTALLALMLRRRARNAPFAGEAEPDFVEETAPGNEAAAEREPQPAVGAAPLETQDARPLRQRYLEERFPEIVNGSLTLTDPKSVVHCARLLYEDGATARAIELLQLATEQHPGEVQPWLALFEIFRLEQLIGPFAELAARFHACHADSAAWPKVQAVGREMEPGNRLYQDASLTMFETIGTTAAARAAATPFDPGSENWLMAPNDARNEALGGELRAALMRDAAVSERDLEPNPMHALRAAESFTVA